MSSWLASPPPNGLFTYGTGKLFGGVHLAEENGFSFFSPVLLDEFRQQRFSGFRRRHLFAASPAGVA
jgi:hypothetical protein